MNAGSVARSTSTTTASRHTCGHTEVRGIWLSCALLGIPVGPEGHPPSTMGGRAMEERRSLHDGGSEVRPLVLTSHNIRDGQSCSVITSSSPTKPCAHILSLFLLTTQERSWRLFLILKVRGQMDWHLPLLTQVTGKRDPGAGLTDVEPQSRNEPCPSYCPWVGSTSRLPIAVPPHHSLGTALALSSLLPIGYLLPIFFFLSLTDTEATSGEGASQSSEY